ncbi:MAG: glycosyl transferase [Legionellales bacterium]|nr:glycosyl transferase [Legionellales bacterium]
MIGKKIFDKVFITHLPSFYKVNLYQNLSKKCSICVIFIGRGSSERPDDFSSVLNNIPHYFLNEGVFEKRNKLLSCLKLFKLLRKIQAKEWVVGGWDLPEFWLTVYLNKKQINAVVVESTYRAASRKNMWLKKQFIKRVNKAYASGNAQLELLDKVGFQGRSQKTGGVGIVDWHSISLFRRQATKFIYVGRFAPEKNLPLLMAAFKQCLNVQLTMVGDGPLGPALKATASDNVSFISYIPHQQLPKLLSQYDVLILPSHQEAWGIVVEEAQLCGLPVIVSSAVGCANERVQELGGGIIFKNGSLQSLVSAIVDIQDPFLYQSLLKKISTIQFEAIKEKQVLSYIEENEYSTCS